MSGCGCEVDINDASQKTIVLVECKMPIFGYRFCVGHGCQQGGIHGPQ